jgi:hypothetical protein
MSVTACLLQSSQQLYLVENGVYTCTSDNYSCVYTCRFLPLIRPTLWKIIICCHFFLSVSKDMFVTINMHFDCLCWVLSDVLDHLFDFDYVSFICWCTLWCVGWHVLFMISKCALLCKKKKKEKKNEKNVHVPNYETKLSIFIVACVLECRIRGKIV